MKLTQALTLSAFALATPAHAWLPAVISDHMVLQAGKSAPLWGRDLPGTTVTASIAGVTVTALAGDDGRWSAKLPPLQPGGPFELVITGRETVTVHDVLLGQVWLGSGQSNMEFPLKNTRDREKDVPAAEHPTIRLFNVERVAALAPEPDVKGAWKLCTPDSAKDFSAVAYHFGVQLQQDLQQPIGLIVACWGGTPGEDWLPRAVLDTDKNFAKLLKGWDADEDRQSLWNKGRSYALELSDLRLEPKDPKAKPLRLGLDPKAWRHGEKPGSSGAIALKEGVLRYSGRIQGGAWGSMARDLKEGGAMDLNAYKSLVFDARGHGKYIPAFGQASIQDYDYYAGTPFDLSSKWKEHRVDLSALKQGGWGAPKALTLDAIQHVQFATQVDFWPEIAGVAYNGMIAPLLPYGLAGVLWYQGESNAGRARQYQRLLSLLVNAWRQGFQDPALPFLAVQLPNYDKACAQPCESPWAELRDSQRRAMEALPYAGVVYSLDQGDAKDIHPKHKTEVARRLKDLALGIAYERPAAPHSPRLLSVTAQEGGLRLDFEPSALSAKAEPALGFELAGADRKFQPATALARGPQIFLQSSGVKDPRWVRYAWADDPVWSIVDSQGVPLGSFEASLAGNDLKTE